MKRLIGIILLLSTVVYVFSQNRIKYTYDSAGNRTKKEIILSPTRSLLSSEKNQVLYIEEKQSHEIKIYPNPTKGLLNIKLAEASKANGEISIYNIAGELIKKTEFSDSYHTFDLSTQPNGIYTVQIMIEDKVYRCEIIKE